MATAAESSAAQASGRQASSVAVGIVALLHLGLLLVLPSVSTPLAVLVVELVSVCVLCVGQFLDGTPARSLLILIVLFGIGIAGTWAIQQLIESLLAVALILTGSLTVLSYGIHRYELVVLGLVEESDEQ
jgi:hypothetical protein